MDHKRKRFKVVESIYLGWITKENVLKLGSLYVMCGSGKKMCLSWGIYISCVDNQRKSFKVPESIYLVWITKEKILKLQSLYIVCELPKKMF